MTNSTAIRIDGLQISNWSEEILAENLHGGVNAINATCAVWEGPAETLQRIGDWYQLFRHHGDVARLVLTGADLRAAADAGVVGILLGFQNASPFGDDITLVEVFHRLGVRIAQLTYNIQNLLGGSCYDAEDGGLTSFGKNVVEEMNRVGMVVDLSHVGNRTSRDAIAASSQPVAITHANPLWFHDTPRNKPNDVMEAVAADGGVVGLCLYPNVIGGRTTTRKEFCQMVSDVADQVGIERVGVASDSVRGWDDSYVSFLRNGRWRKQPPGESAPEWPTWPDWFSGPQDFSNLEDGLAEVGMTSLEVDQVLGGNWLDYFDRVFCGAEA